MIVLAHCSWGYLLPWASRVLALVQDTLVDQMFRLRAVLDLVLEIVY